MQHLTYITKILSSSLNVSVSSEKHLLKQLLEKHYAVDLKTDSILMKLVKHILAKDLSIRLEKYKEGRKFIDDLLEIAWSAN